MTMRLLPACCLVLFTAGCGEQPPVRAVPDGVTPREAANATFPSENSPGGRLVLREGNYADAEGLVAGLEPLTAGGDLDADGVAELAVVRVTGTGGSGQYRDLHVLSRAGNGVAVSQPGFLGDRVLVDALRIDGSEVVVDLRVQGPDDPLCCPTRATTYRFRLAGDRLVETTGNPRLYLQP